MRRIFRGGFRNFGSPYFNAKNVGASFGPFSLFAPEYALYRKRGVVGRLIDKIPAPLKAFAAVTGMAAVTVLLAPAIIILAGPPLLVGAWYFRKQRRMFQNMAQQLHDQRWKDMASFHLQDIPHTETCTSNQRIPTTARIIIENAVENNEQGVADRLHIPKELHHSVELEFGDLQTLYQDFRMSTQGFNERMLASEYPIYVNGQMRGIARVISRGNSNSDQSKGRIELVTKNSLIVLKTPSQSDAIIEGHGTRID